MKRRLFNLVAFLSLVLFVASAVLWLRSYFVAQYLGYGFLSAANPNISDDNVELGCKGGRVYVLCYANSFLRSFARRPGFRWGSFPGVFIQPPSYPTDSPKWLMNMFGIGWNPYAPNSIGSLIFPAWILVALSAVLPAIWMCRRYRSRPPRIGFCQKCGYNLTGNVSGICPECGTAIAAKTP